MVFSEKRTGTRVGVIAGIAHDEQAGWVYQMNNLTGCIAEEGVSSFLHNDTWQRAASGSFSAMPDVKDLDTSGDTITKGLLGMKF